MSNFLASILGGAQAAPSIPQPQTYSRDLERRAKANGFNSAEEMMLWAKQRNTPTGGTIPQGRGPAPSAEQALAWHPKNILSYVLSKIQGATGD